MAGLLACGTLAAVLVAEEAVAERGIAGTAHNLSATGPGPVKEPGVGEICVFCHTPHNARPARGLWNRDLPAVTYKLYESSTLEAKLNQPTGASRLCLSCHDGTTALGNLRVSRERGRITLERLTGRASLGTDLSDDHPISFVYDSALALKKGDLVDPAALPEGIRLDDTQQLQCTACHDAHEERHRKFLRKEDRDGVLCVACHKLRNWIGSAHATSPATWRGTGTNPWPNRPFGTVAENGCGNCHQPHAAPRPPRLLTSAREHGVCVVCHNGRVASKNLEAEFLKPSAHPIASTDWTHDPAEDPATMPRHVTCTDCHNPHQAVSIGASPPAASGGLKGVRGVNVSGGTVKEASYEYEVCLKCHGIRDETVIGIVRDDNTRNVREEINPSNASYHPLSTVGRNSTMGGFEPRYSPGSIIYCTDCHNNDEWTAGGIRPRGPHGSLYPPILEREYQMNDPSAESYPAYALCYKCHNRSFLINDRANTFPHRQHVVTAQASCGVCHDAHGSRRNIGLINFMRRDRSGKTVVGPNSKGLIQFQSTEPGRGRCSLSCHGKDHDGSGY